jgi:hypothetical protein
VQPHELDGTPGIEETNRNPAATSSLVLSEL